MQVRPKYTQECQYSRAAGVHEPRGQYIAVLMTGSGQESFTLGGAVRVGETVHDVGWSPNISSENTSMDGRNLTSYSQNSLNGRVTSPCDGYAAEGAVDR
jgi:hypothetical protein